MIQNDRQYKITKNQIARLDAALELSRRAAKEMDTRVYKAMAAGLESQIADLKQELREYDALKHARSLAISSWDRLGEVLVRARVASGLTQKTLAERMRLKPQQIQKYEATHYRSASLKRIADVSRTLGLELEGNAVLRRNIHI